MASGRTVLVALAVLAAGGIGAGAVALTGRDAAPPAAADAPAKASTAAVVRTDLSDTREVTGTLGFGTEKPLKGGRKGTVTWLPASGDTVRRGKTLYRVDDRPVPVFYGGTPLFRKLGKPGLTGGDVKVVADNLVALGYDIGPYRASGSRVSTAGGEQGKFTASLSAAVKRWQKRVGMAPTGTLDVGDVAVLPGEVRVGGVGAQLGDDATGQLMTVTTTAKAVTVPMDATEVGAVKRGGAVTVVLPDGTEVPGTVASVSRIATGGAGGADAGGPGQDGGPAKVDVTVRLKRDGGAGAENLDAASVRVRFTTATRDGVLAVPVAALVALREGGYAVQVPGGALIAVKTGMFARGMVEVTGEGLRAGTRVVTAS
ncbi:peptidoglycan-binding protein [Streptomyces sp. NPDC050504]|uniref:peptidoglycan-binding protein n=1 Tax=Streptomyces sp. NPDC050504 TaxID=3365618 RepID=UPI0037936A46